MAAPPPRAAVLGKLWLVLAGLALALAGAEAWFRFVRPIEFMRIRAAEPDARGGWYGLVHRPSSAPGLAYELVPGLDRVAAGAPLRTNSLGMRDDEPLPRDTPGLFRVLALGDSVTYGYRVAAEEGFCSVLEREFAAAPPRDGVRVEVLNTGVSGYSSRDEALAFEGKWQALQPDLVLIGYCLNDPESEARQPLPRFFTPPRWWQHSALLRYLVQRSRGKKIRELGGGDYFRYLHAPGEAPWESVERSFDRIGELARAKQLPVVLAIFPLFSPEPWADYGLRAVHAQVAEAARSRGFLALDLLPRFEREPPESLIFDQADSHPNALGHRLAAEEIARFLREHWAEVAPGR
jgi:lysophospholipase L1-like esterase